MPARLNAFISFDFEGMSAVSSWREIKKDSSSLQRLQMLATDEVNATIRGIKRAHKHVGDITVCDSHAAGENLLIERLEKGVYLTKGSPRNYYMVEGINENYDILFFIGYHAMVGTKRALMDHSYSSSSIYNIKVNGKYVGETEINAAVAGHHGVPLGLVSGDDQLIKEVKKFFGAYVETVITKYGISRHAAKCRHPADVQEELENKAFKAVKKVKKLKPFTFKRPIKAELEVVQSLIGDVVELIPGLKRVETRRFSFTTKDTLEFYRVLRLICNLGMHATTNLT
ncbi:MAG: M55 family metallopeptidase [candidate division WOR-3 bacterium]|nr:MAG: M55 family metallopeptidase [candidate division WOR-3 bacterium]